MQGQSSADARRAFCNSTTLLIAAPLLLPVVGANAAPVILEEVVVTAQIRSENLQDVPISVATMSGEKIDAMAITSLTELTTYLPNVNINRGTGTPNLFIRGIGSGTNAGFEQSVGMFVDGVYSGRGALVAVPATLDMARVEVLKGPQGILFGKNTIAGAVSQTTNKPTDEFEGMVEGLWKPNHGEQLYNLVLSGPLTQSLSGRLAVQYNSMGGWWDNVTLDETGPKYDNHFARGSLRWDASEKLELLAKYEYGRFSRKNGPNVVYQSDFAGQENFAGTVPFPVLSDRDDGAGDVASDFLTRTDVFALTVNWDVNFATLTSISAYSAYDRSRRSQNSDSAATAALNRSSEEDFKQFSQELRFVSPVGDRFDWIAGAYYQASELDISRVTEDLDFALSGPLSVPALVSVDGGPSQSTTFDQETESWAVFGQSTWHATESLQFTGGVRYTDETKDVDKIIPVEHLGVRSGPLTVFANPDNGELISDLRSHDFSGLSRHEEKLQWSVVRHR